MTILKYSFLPLFLLGGNFLALQIINYELNHLFFIPLIFLFILLSFVAERVLPYQRAFNQPQQDTCRDTLHAIINETITALGLLMMPLLPMVDLSLALWPSQLPNWQQLLLAIFIADIGITLTHYISHHSDFLWKFHAVHHSVKRMYGFNGLMKHPLHQMLETSIGVFPLIILGIPDEILALLAIAVTLQLLTQHSNVDYATGPLKYVLAINCVHRFHHLNNSAEGNVNFGLFSQFTDLLLGTRYYDQHKSFNKQNLGISSAPNYPDNYLDQLLQPFRKPDIS